MDYTAGKKTTGTKQNTLGGDGGYHCADARTLAESTLRHVKVHARVGNWIFIPRVPDVVILFIFRLFKMVTIGQKWHNELNSTMVITELDQETGVFGGKYQSLVGDADRWYVLTGRQDTEGKTLG